MHRIILVALASAAMTAAASAERQTVIALPEIIIGGSAPEARPSQRCVDVQIGTDRAYDCLNLRLRQQVDRVNPSANAPPLDARSPDTRLGIVNMHALQQQYGRNFGVSVFPHRPAAPVFTPPLGRH
jgi:hypothetical protein